MALFVFPLKSINGSNMYNNDDFRQYFANFISTGILANVPLAGSTAFQVTQTDNPSMNVIVGSGVAWIIGGQVMNTSPLSFQIPAPLTSQSRTDSIVVQWSNSSNNGDIIYKQNSTQVVQTNDVYELQLCKILVPANATNIPQANITDMRADTSVCGFSSPYEAIKTGDLLAQFKSELEANGVLFSQWFETIKGQLSEDAAGNLQNQINNSVHNAGNISTGTDLNDIRGVGYYRIGGLVGATDVLNTPSEVNGIRFYAFLIVIGSLQELTVYSPKQDTTCIYSRSISGSPSTWSIWSKTVMADENGKTSVKDLEVTGKITQGISESISFPIGYGASVNARRTGNLVEILFSGQTSTQMSGGATMNEKIPDGFRPADVTSIDFLSPGKHLDTYYYFNPDGTITYQGETLTAKSFLRGVRTYFTNDPWPVIE
ncbi:pyocin knob domain-containing protein [Lactococcus lactis]|uniref:pyocin knob domain-containing protein n=1 Tax=Lactococcus lactis TaxID=1358 RepID=UPI0028900475|nr:pyocin knob domain-containing protein [Lactococcus lactis]MDT2872873.1 pyocin knob domain-containing protein [Lactococcus lactis]MDT2934710.1 pyocin knob domain-containing protein [Lactococcus lactis]